MKWKTFAECRDDLIRQVEAASGPNWPEQLDKIAQRAISLLGTDLDDETCQTVLEAVQARRRRQDVARKRMAGEGGVPGAIRQVQARAAEAVRKAARKAAAAAAAPAVDSILPQAAARIRREIPPEERAMRDARIGRRRFYAKVGRLPGSLAHPFTLGQQSALAIVLYEIQQNGACTLAIDAIASFARVCRRVVQSAIRQAQIRGLLLVRSQIRAPNRISILSKALAEWVGTTPSRRREKVLENQNITQAQKGARKCMAPSVQPSTAKPAPAPAELPAPVAAPAAPPAAEPAVEAPQPVETPEPVLSRPTDAERPEPAQQVGDVFDEILRRIGLLVRRDGFDPVAVPGAG